MAQQDNTVTINGKPYVWSELSEAARDQLTNLRACDEEIARLKRQQAIAQAARMTYSHLLERELPASAEKH
ncbi:DUF6447 family protein [Kushneria aurantia]|uniref:DUF6447 family protein n=1 Tax=Kushneria aurantia TaxID=504092 RepID=A0ABV6FZB5_9GAMM|nr:DUF6447 family protein [Kushneria aurantia]